MSMPKKVNKVELAEILGVNERTLSTWQKNGLPIEDRHVHGRENLYDTAKVIQWLIQRHSQNLTRSGGEILDLEAEKARLTKAQADSTELKLAQQRGELLDAKSVQAEWEEYIMACRAKLLSLPSKLAAIITHETEPTLVQATLQDAIHEALSELSQNNLSASEPALGTSA